MNKRKYIFISSLVIVVVILTSVAVFTNKKSAVDADKVDQFAQCISDSNAKFYGAFWCSHCQNQKKLFNSSKNLPYVECSNPDGSTTEVCQNENIEAFPTWKFADGSQILGELSFEALSEKTSCPLPY